MKRALFTMLAALALVACLGAADSIGPVQGLYRDKENICSVFSVRGDGVWMTAFHCVDAPQAAEVTVGEPGEAPKPSQLYVGTLEASILAAWPQHDLAVLKTSVGAKPFKLARQAPKIGDFIQGTGTPLGLSQLLWRRGYVSSVDYQLEKDGVKFIIAAMPSCGGFSGSPMLNEAGELVSVDQISLRRFEPCAGFVGGINYEQLKADLRDIGIK